MKKCPACSNKVEDDAIFCPECGARFGETGPKYETTNTTKKEAIEVDDLPPRYKPLSPWAYVGYTLLYSIPIVGFIFLIVNSTGASRNINKRNFALSYWAALAILAGAIIIAFIICAILGISFASLIRYLE